MEFLSVGGYWWRSCSDWWRSRVLKVTGKVLLWLVETNIRDKLRQYIHQNRPNTLLAGGCKFHQVGLLLPQSFNDDPQNLQSSHWHHLVSCASHLLQRYEYKTEAKPSAHTQHGSPCRVELFKAHCHRFDWIAQQRRQQSAGKWSWSCLVVTSPLQLKVKHAVTPPLHPPLPLPPPPA